MYYFISFVLVLCLGCQLPSRTDDSIQDNKQTSIKQQTSSDATTQDTLDTGRTHNIKRAFFGKSNWIELSLDHTFATIQNHSQVFEKDAFLRITHQGANRIKNLNDFTRICKEKAYVTNATLSGLLGQALFFVNPLHWSSVQRIAFATLNEHVTTVENPFTIKDKKLEIEAGFLTTEEKNSIVNSFILYNFDNLDILRINLFNPLTEPGPEFSSLLARLFCGIADNNASILYTFHNEKGDELLVKINGVVFEAVDCGNPLLISRRLCLISFFASLSFLSFK